MKIEFEATGFTRNPAPAGQPPSYNLQLTLVQDSEINKQAFIGGNVPPLTLTLPGLSDLPIAYEQRTTFDVGGDAQGAPAPATQAAPARRVFRGAGE